MRPVDLPPLVLLMIKLATGGVFATVLPPPPPPPPRGLLPRRGGDQARSRLSERAANEPSTLIEPVVLFTLRTKLLAFLPVPLNCGCCGRVGDCDCRPRDVEYGRCGRVGDTDA